MGMLRFFQSIRLLEKEVDIFYCKYQNFLYPDNIKGIDNYITDTLIGTYFCESW